MVADVTTEAGLKTRFARASVPGVIKPTVIVLLESIIVVISEEFSSELIVIADVGVVV